jgi:hypothetical protein
MTVRGRDPFDTGSDSDIWPPTKQTVRRRCAQRALVSFTLTGEPVMVATLRSSL